MNYRAKRRDANESMIVCALRAVGAVVQQLGDGVGVPDLLVGFQGRTFLIEVKDPKMGARNSRTRGRPKTASGLRESQEQWWAEWRGERPHVVTNADDALVVIGVLR